MSGIVIGIIAGLAAFAFLWFVLYKKDEAGSEKVVKYVCHTCGEKHCDCHKIENGTD